MTRAPHRSVPPADRTQVPSPPPVPDTLAADDYRAFEGGGVEADAFAAALEARTRALADGGAHDAIAAFLRRTYDYPALGSAADYRGGTFRFHRAPDRPHGTLARVSRDDPYGEPERVLVDPVALDPAGRTSIGGWWIDDAGRRAVVTLTEGGSDRQVLRVIDLASGNWLPDRLERIRFASVAWAPDGASFLYNAHLGEAEARERFGDEASNGVGRHLRRFLVLRHRLGTEQGEDGVVADAADTPERIVFVSARRGERVELLAATEGTDWRAEARWRFRGTDEPWRLLQRMGEAETHFLAARRIEGMSSVPEPHDPDQTERWHVWAWTDRDAPRGRLVRFVLADALRPERWRTIVDEERPQGRALEGARVGENHLVALHFTGSAHELTVYDLDGANPRPVPLPTGEASASLWRRRPGEEAFDLRLSTRTADASIHRLDPIEGTLTQIVPSRSPTAMPDAPTLRIDVPVSDGERVPVSIVHAPGRPPGPDTPMLLTAYGGFGAVVMPYFDPLALAFVAMGGAVATAHIRGGGEKGRAWHEAARRDGRQRAFGDFIEVADHLVAKGSASRERLAIRGASNGGLLVAAVVSQSPDLCAAAVSEVPVTDMLRFHTHHAGPAWIPEYGDPDDPHDAAHLRAYSPLHNVPVAPHPPVLIVTGENDDRVAPWHAHKWAAALIREGASPANVHLAVERDIGHGFGRSREQDVEGDARVLAFLARHLGMDAGDLRPGRQASPLLPGSS